MKSLISTAMALFLLPLTATASPTSGFGDIIKFAGKRKQSTCVIKKHAAPEIFTLREIFPTVIYKTPGRDVGAAQLYEPLRKIAEPLSVLATECLVQHQMLKTAPNSVSSADSCKVFQTWVESLVEQDALHFDREKHQVSGPSLVTGGLSGNLTIRPIAFYSSILRENKLIKFGDDEALNNWLKRRVAEYNHVPRQLTASGAQNLVLYSALARLTVGIATNDDGAALKQAEDIYKLYFDTARPDGSFPQESKRGISALKYENTAIAGLLMVAELAKYRGHDLYSYKSASGVDMHKAVGFYLKAYENQELIKGYASENYAPTDRDDGVGQSKLFARDHSGWIPLYLQLFPDSPNQVALQNLIKQPMIRTSGIYDENMAEISSCVW